MSARNRRESKGEKEEEEKEEKERRVVRGREEKGESYEEKGTRENKWICDEVTFSYPRLKSWRWCAIFPLLFGAVAHNL